MRPTAEILAPAGSYEGFEAAIAAGADAVYMGGSAFGARAYAKNFQTEELLKAIDVAHIHDKKIYLTVNTLLKNKELYEQLYDYLLPYYKEGLDAVIVQDLGVFKFIKEAFPDMHIHASTQMTVTGPMGMKFLEEAGASRVVTARELSLEEIKEMHKTSPIEIESFVHGALCYSYSGQCLMSSLLGGRSGNRGRCAQPCRLPYKTALLDHKFSGKKELCPLSLKDINTIEILPEIIEAGVYSLKIEGRMKQPEYTAGVTAMYRKYLDLLLDKGKEHYQVTKEDRQYLIDIFSRGGSCSGYYKMHNGPTMLAFTNEKKTGEVHTLLEKPKRAIKGKLMLYAGSPAVLEVSSGDYFAAACTGEVQIAQNQPLEEQRVRQQMEKTGNTPFVWEQLDIEMDRDIFIPMKTLNEVRRQAMEDLQDQFVNGQKREENGNVCKYTSVKNNRNTKLPIYISCKKADTAKELLKEGKITRMYLPFDAMEECLSDGIKNHIDMYLSLPHLTRGKMPEGYMQRIFKWLDLGMKGFLVRNLESYAYMKEQGLKDKCVLDHSLYTWNEESQKFWREEGVMENTLPLELNEGELSHRENHNSEMVVYGYLPLMISAQCVRKSLYGCNKKQEQLFLKDRYDKEFPIVCHCDPWKMGDTKKETRCYNMIYNSLPFGLLKEKTQIENLGVKAIRLSFTIEKTQKALSVLRDFYGVYHEGKNAPSTEYTKGHFKRGAK